LCGKWVSLRRGESTTISFAIVGIGCPGRCVKDIQHRVMSI
jgi:hypothetical protein